ncbi:MAG: DUF2577 family protein [Anaerovoracaceae bacterium]
MRENKGKYINTDKLKISMGKAKCIGQCPDYVEGWFAAINHIIKIKDFDGKTGTIKVYGKLKTDDIVILTRNNGGTEYYITDKIGR